MAPRWVVCSSVACDGGGQALEEASRHDQDDYPDEQRAIACHTVPLGCCRAQVFDDRVHMTPLPAPLPRSTDSGTSGLHQVRRAEQSPWFFQHITDRYAPSAENSWRHIRDSAPRDRSVGGNMARVAYTLRRIGGLEVPPSPSHCMAGGAHKRIRYARLLTSRTRWSVRSIPIL